MKKILKRTLPILLAFTLLFGCCISSSAASSISVQSFVDAVAESGGQVYEYVVITTNASSDDVLNVYFSDNLMSVYLYTYYGYSTTSSSGCIHASGNYSVYYVSNDLSSVEFAQSGSATGNIITPYFYNASGAVDDLSSLQPYIVASNADLQARTYSYYWINGNEEYGDYVDFFQQTPEPSPSQVALGKMMENLTITIRQILTIAVVCLASLVILSVLRKRLPIFLH